MNDLVTSNNQKNDELFQICEKLGNIEREENEGLGRWNPRASVQSRSTQKASKSLMSKTMSTHMAFSIKPNPELLSEQVEELNSIFEGLESRLEVEKETQNTLENKITILSKDQVSIILPFLNPESMRCGCYLANTDKEK